MRLKSDFTLHSHRPFRRLCLARSRAEHASRLSLVVVAAAAFSVYFVNIVRIFFFVFLLPNIAVRAEAEM